MSTPRTREIAARILDCLNEWDAPVDEAVIHMQVNPRLAPEALVSEFSDALALCERERWITGIRNKLRGTRWSITDNGKAARHS